MGRAMTEGILLNQLISYYKLCESDPTHNVDLTKALDQSILDFYTRVQRELTTVQRYGIIGAVFIGDLILSRLLVRVKSHKSLSNAFLLDRNSYTLGKIGKCPVFHDRHAPQSFIDRDRVLLCCRPSSAVEMPLSRLFF